MNDYLILVGGIESLKDVDTLDEKIINSARIAVNKATDKARVMASEDIRSSINLGRNYLAKRLTVVKRASGNDLEGMIRGSDNPTMLARFASTRNPRVARKAGGVTVSVKPGSAKFMKGAFLMDLGNTVGLAIRVKPGESLRNRKNAKRVANGLYLLYGPSVNQAFRLVADDRLDDVLDILETEYNRQMDLA